MKLRNLVFYFVLFIAIGIGSCKKKPFDNFNLDINSDLMKYRALVQIFDASNANMVPANIRLSVSGLDGDHIYTLTGSKTFTVENGIINIGVDPVIKPTDSRPVSFVLVVSADGYLPVSRQINISPAQTTQQIGIAMTNLLTPPGDVRIAQTALSLSNGQISEPSVLKDGRLTRDSLYYDDKITSVILPVGTSFYYIKTNHNTVMGTRIERVNQYKQDSSYQSGGATITPDPPIVSYYYDTVHFVYDSVSYIKTLYTGSTLNVVCMYRKGVSTTYALYDPRYYAAGPDVTIMDGTKVRGDELLFTSAVQDALTDIRFIGKVTVNGVEQDLDLSPDSAAHWFTSFVLNTGTVNPLTHAAIKEGDSIECGVNPFTGTTLKTVIYKANGTLRAAMQSLNVGYYFQAPYVYQFEYDLNGTINPDNIPDPENLYSNAYIDLGPNMGYVLNGQQYGRYYPMAIYPGYQQYAAKACCAQPITQDVALLNVTYWGRTLKKTNLVQKTTVNVFDPPYNINLPDAVSISYKMKCSQKTIHPTSYFTITYSAGTSSGSFYCNVINGQWKTRGLTQGQTYTIGGHMCDFSITKSYKVDGNYIQLVDSIPEVCNCILK